MKSVLRGAVCTALLVTTTAFAGQIGEASKSDVVLAGDIADDFAYSSNVNDQGGPPPFSFESAFDAYGDGAWEKMAKVTKVGNAYPLTYENSLFLGKVSFTFALVDGKNGIWSMTSLDMVNDLMFDLVFAMHVGGGSGAWLFNDQAIGAGQTLQGTWTQKMVNGNNRVTDFSNLTFFGRQEPIDPIIDVPEPATLASLALSLGMLGLVRRRRHK